MLKSPELRNWAQCKSLSKSFLSAKEISRLSQYVYICGLLGVICRSIEGFRVQLHSPAKQPKYFKELVLWQNIT
jgi:hypothetical protein